MRCSDPPSSLWRQWLPTSLGASMLVLEVPLVAAAVARSGSADRGIAALGIAIAIIVVANGPALALAPLVVTLDGRCDRRDIMRYSLVVGLVAVIVVAACGLARPALIGIFGLNQATAAEASGALLALAPASIVVAVRRYQHGRLIARGWTTGIGVATGVRLVVSATVAWSTAPAVESGAVLGGCALTLGACCEAAALAAFLRRRGAHGTSGDGVTQRAGLPAIAREHAPLAAARILNMIPQLITTVGIAHAALSLSSLAAWPVVYGLLSLFTGPLMDYETVGAAALRRHPDDPSALRLGVVLIGGVSTIYGVVLFTPLLPLYLSNFSGLTGEPLRLGVTWSVWTLLIPAAWVVRGHVRAQAMASRRSQILGYGVGVHLVGLVTILGASIGAGLPGLACATFAVLGGIVTETTALAIVQRRKRS